jgi:prepilin-type N-terminal cleavage/methylation domain-containing protein
MRRSCHSLQISLSKGVARRSKSGLYCLSKPSGYTFVELLVALVIAAGIITVAILAYSATSYSKSKFLAYTDVTLPSGRLANMYGTASSVVTAHAAPNFGRSAMAEMLKDKLYEDLADASAVFCLSRTDQSTIRPAAIPLTQPYDFTQISTPEAFRLLLATEISSSAAVFSSYRGTAPGPNSSLFILSRSATSTELHVKAIYECDIVEAVSPAGSYVSVRRYQNPGNGAVCTHFYDVFYPESTSEGAFTPVAVFFERKARLAMNEGALDLVKRAENQPFYFWWWPDPAAESLENDLTAVGSPTETKDLYRTMNGRTAFFLVIPAYPALW